MSDFPEEDDEPAVIVACQGKPACDLEGDEAVAAIRAGCPFCRRETWFRGEMIALHEPSRA